MWHCQIFMSMLVRTYYGCEGLQERKTLPVKSIQMTLIFNEFCTWNCTGILWWNIFRGMVCDDTACISSEVKGQDVSSEGWRKHVTWLRWLEGWTHQRWWCETCSLNSQNWNEISTALRTLLCHLAETDLTITYTGCQLLWGHQFKVGLPVWDQ